MFHSSMEHASEGGEAEGSASAFDEVARLGRVLGNGARLQVLLLLAQGERPVQEVAARTDLNMTTASAHLHALRDVGLVASRREGRQVIYRLAGDDVAELLTIVQQVAERRHPAARLALEVRDARLAEPLPDGTTAMGREELLTAVREGRVTVLDVRPAEEFASGHLPGALSIPLDELAARLHEVPVDQEVVAYCRGRLCTLSKRAAGLLAEHGRMARAAAEGVLEWRADGVALAVPPEPAG